MHNKYEDIIGSDLDSLAVNLSDYLQEYKDCFRTETQDMSELSEQYISGLLKTEHSGRNIERSHEELNMDGDGYQQLQNFITDSPWDGQKVISAAARKTSELYMLQPGYDESDIGYIIDQSAHLKKGGCSVGVARQYAGVVGKAENCLAGVYTSLVWQSHTALINRGLFLPECWSSDNARCEKAGIPPDERTHKSGPQSALEMLKVDIEAGVRFGQAGGDGLYGHGFELSYAVHDMEMTFLFEVHDDQSIFELEPTIPIPEKKPGTDTNASANRIEACHR